MRSSSALEKVPLVVLTLQVKPGFSGSVAVTLPEVDPSFSSLTALKRALMLPLVLARGHQPPSPSRPLVC